MAKPLTDILRESEDGRFIDEATQDFNKLLQAVIDTNKPGVMTIQIGIEPAGRKTFAIHTKHTIKEPKNGRIPTTFFLDNHGTLIRDDPDQPKLPLRVVEDDKQVRVVND